MRGRVKGFVCSQITRDKMSMSHTGMKFTDEHKKRIGISTKERVKDVEYIKNLREVMIGHWKDPVYAKNQSDAIKKYWQDPIWAEKQTEKCLEGNQKAHPNKPECQVIEILKSLSSSINYVGDGTYWISGMNPDFIDEKNKKIIEVCGCYWHCCSKCGHHHNIEQRQKDASRVKKFKRLGYSVLVVWEHELKQSSSVIAKVSNFVDAS